jgi:hypothetical protein
MEKAKKIGAVYEFCATCSSCPVAVETDVNGKSGLEIRDDFGGSVKLTDENLKDLENFLDKRFNGR